MAIYLYFVLWPGCSIREVSRELVVPFPRCYRFIRTVMEKISSSSSNKLHGNIEVDEFYIKAGLKGRAYHEEIVKSGRKPKLEDGGSNHGEVEEHFTRIIQ